MEVGGGDEPELHLVAVVVFGHERALGAEVGDAAELERAFRAVEDQVDAGEPLRVNSRPTARGRRGPCSLTTSWLFQRNWPFGSASSSISSSSSSTSGFQAVCLPGGKPFGERCHF